MKVGLLGHGTIGVGVDHILSALPDFSVPKILSNVVDAEMEGRTARDIHDITEDPEIDAVVEVMGGVHPAFEYLAEAMRNGKHAVTANKAVVAACYDELLSIARNAASPSARPRPSAAAFRGS